ncbi:hypothetical protein ACFYRN_25005 [Streptomyces sp. NPDC005227]|uniref:hypothetical protein n=1 Tax=Streptomyces sp. NPDC005227 TaxID=3364707 RepID=UPI0036C66679
MIRPMSLRPEAVAAAAWWAERIAVGAAAHDVGAPASNLFANTVSALVARQRDQAQIERFRDALAELIEQHVDGDGWRPDNPLWGSAIRTVEVGYAPDEILSGAAEQAGFELKLSDLPLKTVMWVNPGEVKVAEGYNAPIRSVWRAVSPS